MRKLAITLYGLISYLLFLGVFVHLAAFLLGIGPATINGTEGQASSPYALLINLGLIAAFGVTHSVMARDWFKAWLTRVVPEEAERSTYVLQSSIFVALIIWFWQPMTGEIWSVGGAAATAITGVFVVGYVVALVSTFLIDHFELFGLRQVWAQQNDRPIPAPTFKSHSFYRLVRHPLQFGILVFIFATPHMTVGHALFALSMTAYIFIGLYFEERALVREFGETYEDYQRRVPMLIPGLKLGRRHSHAAA